jgi:DNA-binding NarL/FixJ family response regulator
MNHGKKRISVVDDHPMLRQGVVKVINLQPDLIVTSEAGTAAEALATLPDADAMLLDLSLKQDDGLFLLKQIKSLRPELPILMFSCQNEEVYAKRALEAGADGYLMKDEPVNTVIDALRSVLQGDIVLSPKMSTRLLRSAIGRSGERDNDSLTSRLSDRELFVFQQLGLGESPTKIATAASVSVKTIESHIANLKLKLGARDSAELRKLAAAWVAQK